ncbi:hypothetical protein BJX99DRAFT_222747 [Aspergillus californicus]
MVNDLQAPDAIKIPECPMIMLIARQSPNKFGVYPNSENCTMDWSSFCVAICRMV